MSKIEIWTSYTQANIYTMSENMYYSMIIIVPKLKQHFEYF